MESHNSALDYIATELELIATGTEHPSRKEWIGPRFARISSPTFRAWERAAMTDQDPEGLSKLGLLSGEARVYAAGAHSR